MSKVNDELPQMECGSELLKSQFLFDQSYRNLNHGMYKPEGVHEYSSLLVCVHS